MANDDDRSRRRKKKGEPKTFWEGKMERQTIENKAEKKTFISNRITVKFDVHRKLKFIRKTHNFTTNHFMEFIKMQKSPGIIFHRKRL